MEFDLAMFELAGAYRPNERLDILFGARFVSTDIEIDFDAPATPDVDGGSDWVDPFIGLRAVAPLGESWNFVFRGDIGGFDVGCEFTWNVEMLFAWEATKRSSLVFGYRHLAIEDEWHRGAETIDVSVAMSGPEVGYAFRF
jgi:hypothetical protein